MLEAQTVAVNRFGVLKSLSKSMDQRLFRHKVRPGSQGDVLATLERVIQDLEALNRSTERDFLAVGEKLGDFRSTANQISSDMAAITELISGEHGRNAAQALNRTLEHVERTGGCIEQSCEALTSVREFSAQIRRGFSGLPNMVSIFRTLCTLTRVETARLGGEGADLGHLTAEVRPLSESIQSSGERVLEASRCLDQEVHSAIRAGDELRTLKAKEMPALIASVLASVQSLDQRRQFALQSSRRQTAQYVAICEALDSLVGSIQFHDITRQQVEHVALALRQLRSACGESGKFGEGPAHRTAVVTLQSSQLAEAARVFASSIDHMQRELETIGQRVENASQSVRELMGISGDDHNSFFVNMENQFSAIVKMLGTCQTAQAEMHGTAAALKQNIGGMRDSVAEIRGTEIQIQRISTNATIRAIHLGGAGVALNKIAEVMQRLALESNGRTEEVAAMLDGMNEAAARVAPAETPCAQPVETTATSSTNGVVEEMQKALGELHSSSESSFRRVEDIATLGSRLAQEIGAIRAGFSAGRLFAEAADRVHRELHALGAQDRAASLDDLGADASEHLDALAKTYTMQRQRDVHEAIVGGASRPISSTLVAAPATASVDNDLGANVELF